MFARLAPSRPLHLRRREPLRALRRAGWSLTLAVIALAPSCQEEQLPRPRTRTSTGATTGAGGGGGTASEATAGSSSTSGIPGPGPATLCECVAAYGGVDGACATCFNTNAAMGARCESQLIECSGEPGCRSVSLCLKDCGRDTACQSDCVFPADAGAAHLAFQRVLSCVCDACGALCAYGEPIPCSQTGGGLGGAGGTPGG